MKQEIKLVDLQRQYQEIREEVIEAIGSALDGMDLFLGPNVRQFEREFADYYGVSEGVGVASGTDAIHLALRACDIGPGDEVITVAHTFIAKVEAIAMTGARPIFVDVDAQTATMDPEQVTAAITPRTRALLPVHLYGQAADMNPLRGIAREYGLWIIEDASQAQGARYHGQRAGALGDVAAFSLYYSKNLGAYGEAGIATTNNPVIAERIRMLRDHGSRARYQHELLGMNSRLDEVHAAVLRVKLRRLDKWNEQRRSHATAYTARLRGRVATPVERSGSEHVYYTYVIQTDERDVIRDALAKKGVQTGIHYPVPLHLQPACAAFAPAPESLPITEQLAGRILSLPMFPELTTEEIERVCDLVEAPIPIGARRRTKGGIYGQ
ncbi:MAG: DegT/DnrJ/EryC1/StrS family aminotransferase [Ktedonobacterales bacterium]